MISVEGINQRFREVEYITSFRGVLLEGTIKLMFDSVWVGVTGGAMVGATSRGGGIHASLMRMNRVGVNKVSFRGFIPEGTIKLRFDSV